MGSGNPFALGHGSDLAVMQLLAGAVNFQAEEANLMTLTAKLQSRTPTLMPLLTTGSIFFGSVFGAEQGSAVNDYAVRSHGLFQRHWTCCLR